MKGYISLEDFKEFYRTSAIDKPSTVKKNRMVW